MEQDWRKTPKHYLSLRSWTLDFYFLLGRETFFLLVTFKGNFEYLYYIFSQILGEGGGLMRIRRGEKMMIFITIYLVNLFVFRMKFWTEYWSVTFVLNISLLSLSKPFKIMSSFFVFVYVWNFGKYCSNTPNIVRRSSAWFIQSKK